MCEPVKEKSNEKNRVDSKATLSRLLTSNRAKRLAVPRSSPMDRRATPGGRLAESSPHGSRVISRERLIRSAQPWRTNGPGDSEFTLQTVAVSKLPSRWRTSSSSSSKTNYDEKAASAKGGYRPFSGYRTVFSNFRRPANRRKEAAVSLSRTRTSPKANAQLDDTTDPTGVTNAAGGVNATTDEVVTETNVTENRSNATDDGGVANANLQTAEPRPRNSRFNLGPIFARKTSKPSHPVHATANPTYVKTLPTSRGPSSSPRVWLNRVTQYFPNARTKTKVVFETTHRGVSAGTRKPRLSLDAAVRPKRRDAEDGYGHDRSSTRDWQPYDSGGFGGMTPFRMRDWESDQYNDLDPIFA